MKGWQAALEDHEDSFLEELGQPPRPLITTINTSGIPARKPVGLADSEIDLNEKTSDLGLETFESPPPLYEEDTVVLDSADLLQSPTSISTNDSPTTEPSKWKTAVEDVRHFAGGLISHPFESTKHFSILRHSHGLVYY